MGDKRVKERGSILLQVMVTGVVMALIAASLMRITMMRHQMISRSVSRLQEKRDDHQALALIISAWNSAGQVCANNVRGYTCRGIAGNCGCTCTPTDPNWPEVRTQNASPGGVATCRLDIVSADRP